MSRVRSSLSFHGALRIPDSVVRSYVGKNAQNVADAGDRCYRRCRRPRRAGSRRARPSSRRRARALSLGVWIVEKTRHNDSILPSRSRSSVSRPRSRGDGARVAGLTVPERRARGRVARRAGTRPGTRELRLEPRRVLDVAPEADDGRRPLHQLVEDARRTRVRAPDRVPQRSGASARARPVGRASRSISLRASTGSKRTDPERLKISGVVVIPRTDLKPSPNRPISGPVFALRFENRSAPMPSALSGLPSFAQYRHPA